MPTMTDVEDQQTHIVLTLVELRLDLDLVRSLQAPVYPHWMEYLSTNLASHLFKPLLLRSLFESSILATQTATEDGRSGNRCLRR